MSDASETVFIVLAERGEYSERQVWVAGVFRTREEAWQTVAERRARRRASEDWSERYLDALEAQAGGGGGVWRLRGEAYQEAQRRAAEQAGPAPPEEVMERAEIVPMVIGSQEG